MVSVTDDNAGGTMHMWRINDLIYRPEAEAVAELERYKSVPPCSCFILRHSEILIPFDCQQCCNTDKKNKPLVTHCLVEVCLCAAF